MLKVLKMTKDYLHIHVGPWQVDMVRYMGAGADQEFDESGVQSLFIIGPWTCMSNFILKYIGELEGVGVRTPWTTHPQICHCESHNVKDRSTKSLQLRNTFHFW